MNAQPRHVIGLTGLPSSGKGEVTRALAALVEARGQRAAALTFSDQIKEEARRRGMTDAQFDRDLLSRIGIEMRQAEGPGVLAARIAARIESWPPPRPDLVVADGVRHPGEVEVLRRLFGPRFILAAVEADPEEIARRLIARRRPDESREALQSQEHAVRLLERELRGQASSLGPNVGECARLADARLPNHGSLDDLRRTVEQFFGTLP